MVELVEFMYIYMYKYIYVCMCIYICDEYIYIYIFHVYETILSTTTEEGHWRV